MTNRYVRYADNEINEIHKRASPVENIFRTSNLKKLVEKSYFNHNKLFTFNKEEEVNDLRKL